MGLHFDMPFPYRKCLKRAMDVVRLHEHSTRALGCMKGGLVTRRLNEVRDEIADLAQMAYGPSAVRIEPTVREGTTSIEGLRADISVRGVYESQVEASLDIRVTDTDAESFKLKSILQVLKMQEAEKKRKYKKACDERRWHFFPSCMFSGWGIGQGSGWVPQAYSPKISQQMA